MLNATLIDFAYIVKGLNFARNVVVNIYANMEESGTSAKSAVGVRFVHTIALYSSARTVGAVQFAHIIKKDAVALNAAA